MPAVRSVDWARYGADPTEVADAFESLVNAEDAYDALCDVLIHNHSGEAYATAGPAAPLLAQVVEQFTGEPRMVALSVLGDLMRFAAAVEVRSAVAGLEPLLRQLSSGRLNKPIPATAHDLIVMLDKERRTFAEKLADWTDADYAAFALGQSLGLFTGIRMLDIKGVFWSVNPLGDGLHDALMALVRAGVLEMRDGESQFRWLGQP